MALERVPAPAGINRRLHLERPLMDVRSRAAGINRRAACGKDSVLLCKFPRQRMSVDKNGVPYLLVRRSPRRGTNQGLWPRETMMTSAAPPAGCKPAKRRLRIVSLCVPSCQRDKPQLRVFPTIFARSSRRGIKPEGVPQSRHENAFPRQAWGGDKHVLTSLSVTFPPRQPLPTAYLSRYYIGWLALTRRSASSICLLIIAARRAALRRAR
ncbi:hypothetical protein KCP73_17935 [Salmonella enterica subsp. enterica]|nr:hypothetical protein KCP73_17935 [Salmonella enterica subsp. enterica]